MVYELVMFFLAFMALILWTENRQKSLKDGKKLLPGPIAFPLIGGMIQLGIVLFPIRNQIYYKQLQRLCKRYGSVYGAQVGQQYYVIIEDFETAKEVMNSAVWSPRFPAAPQYMEHTYDKNLGMMWSSGESHKEMRRFSSRTLKSFGFGELRAADVFLEEEWDTFVRKLDLDRAQNGDEIFMRKYFKIPTFNILWRVMSGKRFSYDDEEMKRLIHFVEDGAEIQIGKGIEFAFPALRKIPGLSQIKRHRSSIDGLHQFFEDIMEKRRKVGTFRESQNDFMDYFLYKVEAEKGNKDTLYTDQQFVQTCLDLLAGGVDTTANSLEFAVLYMLKYPDVQQKVRDEIHSVVGINGTPSNTDRASMPYSEATMLEVFRHANIVPINGRTSACDTVLNGCFVPKGAFAAINLTSLHLSEEIWGDPEAFRPERFLDSNMRIINDDKIFPFGGGPRICLGYTMAKVIWLGFFTRLLQRYTIELSPVHPKISLDPKGGVANTAQPFYCNVKSCTNTSELMIH